MKVYHPIFKNGDKETIDTALKEISDQWHDKRSRATVERDFPIEIINEAKRKFPQEENEGVKNLKENRKTYPNQ